MSQNNEPTISSMNEAICEFMGGHRMIFDTIHVYKGPDEIEWETGHYLKYNTSWDWLIPVVKKIKGMHLDILRQSFVMEYMHAAAPMNNGLISIDLEKLHKGVYQFIQWYNQSKPTTNGTTE